MINASYLFTTSLKEVRILKFLLRDHSLLFLIFNNSNKIFSIKSGPLNTKPEYN